jgi:hypothetical protein
MIYFYKLYSGKKEAKKKKNCSFSFFFTFETMPYYQKEIQIIINKRESNSFSNAYLSFFYFKKKGKTVVRDMHTTDIIPTEDDNNYDYLDKDDKKPQEN